MVIGRVALNGTENLWFEGWLEIESEYAMSNDKKKFNVCYFECRHG